MINTITLSNEEINYLYDIEIKYKKQLEKTFALCGNLRLKRFACAIKVVETANRGLLSRIIEYLFLLINLTLNKIFNVSILNMSIGVFQIKICYIFDILRITYIKHQKKLSLDKSVKMNQIIKIFSLSNKCKTLELLLNNNFEISDWENLSNQQLEQILLFYSRNVEFKKDELNYYTIVEHLYNNSNL